MKRRSAKTGRWIVVPEPAELMAWQAAAAMSSLPDEQKRVTRGIAVLIGHARTRGEVQTCDRIWIDYDELAAVS